jgi:lysophospholipase L1-like esterase
MSIKFFKRAVVFIAYILFLLLLFEGLLRLTGVLLLAYRDLTENSGITFDNKVRILAIGESTTYGLGVEPGMAYPKQLERLLNQHVSKGVTVINMGVPGQTSTSILRSIDYQMQKYRPHLVISLFGVNDTNEAVNDLSSQIAFGFYVPEYVARLRIYRLTSLMKDYLLHSPSLKGNGAWIFYDPGQTNPDGSWIHNPYYQRQLEFNYNTIIEKVRSHGARMVMLSYLRSDRWVRDLLEDIAENNNVDYIDLFSPEMHTSEFFTDDNFHPNENGHQVMAEKVHRGLEQKGILSENE